MTARRLGLLALLTAARPALGAFNDVGAGARAPGMGNAFTAVADDVYAVYYNPAGLAQLQRPQLSASYSRFYLGLTDGSDIGLSQLTAASPIGDGRWGALGFGYQRLGLSGVYTEDSLYLSGARSIWNSGDKRLMTGLNAKYLRRSFSPPSEAFAACDGLACNNGVDPVLAGPNSKGAVDADLGLLYRFGKLSLGLSGRHLLQPDIGFGGPEKLPMDFRLGAAYHTLWLNLAADLHMDRDATGAMGRRAIVAVERFFPSLEHGLFGARAGLGLGNGDWRQLSTGFSYRISKIQVDYAFLLPIGMLAGTQGTHRVALSMLFGGMTPEEELSASILERMKKLREANKGIDLYELESQVRPTDLNDPRLADVKQALEERQYRKAHGLLQALVLKEPTDEPLKRLLKRLDAVVAHYNEHPLPQEVWDRALTDGIFSFMETRDSRAVLKLSYSASLKPEEVRIDRLLGRMEELTQVKAIRLPSDHPRGFIAELLYRSEMAYRRGDNARVLELANSVLILEEENPTALERAASIHYLLGQYGKALEGWRRALLVESNPREQEALQHHVALVERKLGLSPGTAPASTPESAPERALPPSDPRAIEELYQKGVEHFARGETLQATGAFLRVLQLDPGNEPAKKALERIRRAKGP